MTQSSQFTRFFLTHQPEEAFQESVNPFKALERSFKRFYAPAPATTALPPEEMEKKYPWMRWQILESTFLGYATFYLVRNNLAPAQAAFGEAMGYDKTMLGTIITATAISYGMGKFIMGGMSDRSNPRVFMATGLILSAICNFLFGMAEDYHAHLFLWSLNGFFQGMGWGPCGRSLGHWFALRERGTIFGVWNIAHNVGGATIGALSGYLAKNYGWENAFIVPGVIALIGAAYLIWRLRDTPQSVGLPPVESYIKQHPNRALDFSGKSYKESGTNDHEPEILHHPEVDDPERELTTKELFFNYILTNPALWLFALCNFFVYIGRYSLLDWGPTYLAEEKGATLLQGGNSNTIFEVAGIFSTLLVGWLSDRLGGRRGMVSLLCLIPILGSVIAIWMIPPGHLYLDLFFFGVIGFFIYPPVMLLGVAGLDFTSKKAVGAAAGFIGLFGYAGRAVQGTGLGWIAENYGWHASLSAIAVCMMLAIILLSFTWKLRPHS
ncbi:MAG TPA: MFS transporter [Leptospiraceae bacterium]|nr:MFS transporter [Spirochaetaceae bacterium]HBS03755.1 MFS transporter [Leptospiraceae bacterium]|tara:strand:- start:52755 stop:54236 length:1482 start_codon:yes stop_codon:yes gene_type:complete